jgi:hypothetical protein
MRMIQTVLIFEVCAALRTGIANARRQARQRATIFDQSVPRLFADAEKKPR